ncbi:hypothetical protein [Mesorhizobium sp. B2-8-9]|uniref:hypothetical protein n=1 Tax=Mesorhizobium sp. B2-8-9 TaxID=2589899 RepID=UPI00112CECFA|nr:hypothetical protein [Mesorhizobium sp. B2-8-9]TPI85233.1 hypothetical protein FJ423_02565 [Mesorhizobium sp. B2-8-9]
MAIFEYLRLSLIRPDQSSLIGSDGGPAREITRREYLERVLSPSSLDFEYRGSHYTLLRDGIYGNIFVGRVGKQVIEPYHRGPEQGFAIDTVDGWRPVWLLLDLSSDSQLIAIQTGIASSKNLLQALFERIQSSLPAREYEAFIEYVSDAKEFWRVVEQNRGKLTRLEFTFVPPNALGLEEKIKAIVEAAKGVGSEKTKFTHTNQSGALDPKGEYVEAALKATSEGAGSVSLKSGRKTVFSSEKNRKTADIPTAEVPQQKDDAAIN